MAQQAGQPGDTLGGDVVLSREAALSIAGRHAENYPRHLVVLIGFAPGRGKAECLLGCQRVLATYDETAALREEFSGNNA
jgi:hypothetical protein